MDQIVRCSQSLRIEEQVSLCLYFCAEENEVGFDGRKVLKKVLKKALKKVLKKVLK